MRRILAIVLGLSCFAGVVLLGKAVVQADKQASPLDLGVDRAALVAKLQQAYECKADDTAGSTTCKRTEITVVVQGAIRAKSITFIFPLDNEEQLAGGSVTMVALAKDVFPTLDYAKWYERNLGRMKRGAVKLIQDGVQISASTFGKSKNRLLVVWTTEQAAAQ